MQPVPSQPRQRRHWFINLLLAPVFVYFLFVAGWLMARTIYEDRWWWLFLLNAGTPYLLLPLPFTLLLALIVRRPLAIAFSILLLVPGAPLLAAPWMPSVASDVTARSSGFRVMTFNINGANDRPDRVIAAIREARADIVALQELNPDIAAALEHDLKNDYPYQTLDPQWGVTGMGVISWFPLRRSAAQLPGDYWIGDPQAVEIDAPGGTMTLLNVHAIPPVGPRDWMTWAIGERERQMEAIAAFAQNRRTPLVVAGDMNATPFHRAYRILESELIDVWRICGNGAGFTWPGRQRTLFGVPLPSWLVRIDYIFISDDLTCVNASVGPWDGFSDHRAVVATLVVGR
ncbi:MAG: endonuclease/exonuclease/phosphatase family protein [Roseiflexus sp.]|nr:endonuclease/exonuclease/phosphatase family protein [Roseiflexus sp.]MDW8145133.1 endonuclease/exonuclease/phosphatase family protein [Roseiflexaceae bacterium]